MPQSGGRRIRIIADEYVDREFGTGALKITPGARLRGACAVRACALWRHRSQRRPARASLSPRSSPSTCLMLRTAHTPRPCTSRRPRRERLRDRQAPRPGHHQHHERRRHAQRQRGALRGPRPLCRPQGAVGGHGGAGPGAQERAVPGGPGRAGLGSCGGCLPAWAAAAREPAAWLAGAAPLPGCLAGGCGRPAARLLPLLPALRLPGCCLLLLTTDSAVPPLRSSAGRCACRAASGAARSSSRWCASSGSCAWSRWPSPRWRRWPPAPSASCPSALRRWAGAGGCGQAAGPRRPSAAANLPAGVHPAAAAARWRPAARGTAPQPTHPPTVSQSSTPPARPRQVYNFWLENIKDWCISRQLWWGHRIPVW